MVIQKEILTKDQLKEIDSLLNTDEYYQLMSTPLKSAESIKMQEKNKLIKFFEFTDLRVPLENADKIIREKLNQIIPLKEYEKVIYELDNAIENAEKNAPLIKETSDFNFQKLFGISDETILAIYELAKQSVHNKEYTDAIDLLTLLTTYCPQVPSFWLAMGLCNKSLSKNTEALFCYDLVKQIDPTNPAPYVYSTEIFLQKRDLVNAKTELQAAENLINSETSPSVNKLFQKFKMSKF